MPAGGPGPAGTLDEVNFWQPSPGSGFRAPSPASFTSLKWAIGAGEFLRRVDVEVDDADPAVQLRREVEAELVHDRQK